MAFALTKLLQNGLFAVLTGLVLQILGFGESLSMFQTRVLAFSNPTNRISTGQCCRTNTPAPSGCTDACQTKFELCLDDMHLKEPTCIFGRASSQIFSGSSLTYDNASLARWLNISTSTSWPGVFGMRLTAVDDSSKNLPSKGIIQSAVFVGKRTPSLNWYFRNETGPVSSMAFGYRILCAPDYYGPNCTIYCNARDDAHGHYGCNIHGNKYCLTGWTNIDNYCTTPICSPSCQHGTCEAPNRCRCNRGWEGLLCSKCTRRLGCVNGTCTMPGECSCNTGWGGNNCDRVTNYCKYMSPCQNGGFCMNQVVGNYRCFCQSGFIGTNCEHRKTACTSNPCLNGGSCQVTDSGYTCNCTAQYIGLRCGTFVDLCSSVDCKNNGTCTVLNDVPECQCNYPYTGRRCGSIQASSSLPYTISASTLPEIVTSSIYGSSIRPTESYTIKLQSTSTMKDLYSSRSHRISSSKLPGSTSITYQLTITHLSFPSSTSEIQLTKQQNTIQTKRTTFSSVTSVSNTAKPRYSVVTTKSLNLFSSMTTRATTTTIYASSSKLASRNISISSQTEWLESSMVSSSGGYSSTIVDTGGGQGRKQGLTRRTLAVAVSTSISLVAVLIIAFIVLWIKLSNRRGQHTFRRPSSVAPTPLNHARNIIDPGSSYNTKRSTSSTINNNYDNFHETRESSSTNSDKSQAISSKDICIENRSIHIAESNENNSRRDYNETNSIMNCGYLSEGTSGYGSGNSSARSSANCPKRILKSSELSPNVIILAPSRLSTRLNTAGDLPHCIVYQEEQI